MQGRQGGADVSRDGDAVTRWTRILVLALVLATSAVVTWAYWSQAGSGSASATSASLDAASISVPGSAINSVTVTWTAQSSLNPSSAANSAITYTVERRLGAGTWGAIASGGCAGAKARGTTSCVDTPATAGSYTYRAVAAYHSWTATSNAAGPVTFTIDVTAPTVGALLTPSANGAGWNNTSPVSVALSASDVGGSGVAGLKYTTDSSDPTSSGTATVYTTALSIAATTTVKYFATDLAGNASAVSTQLVKIDTTAPSAPTLAFSALSNAYASANTIFYRSAASSGAFTVTASSTDAGSGVAGYSFPTLPAGWSASPGTLGVNTYSWIAANPTAPSGGQNITATNYASLTSTAIGLALTADNTAPTGSVTYAGGFYNSASVGVAFSATDGSGSGIDATSGRLQRADATLTTGTCGSYGAFTTVAGGTNPTSPFTDTSVTSGGCYQYQYLASDNLANAGTITSANVVKVDTTAPSAPTLAFSALTSTYASANTIFYRSSATSGAFTVTASATDAGSGVASYGFPTLPSGWSASPGSLGVDTYSWIAANPTAPSGAQNITATNNAALTSTATGLTLTADNAAPTGSVTYTDGYYTSTSVSVAFTATDGSGSGVNATTGLLQRADATLTASTGLCGSYGGFATVTGGTNPTSPFADTSVTNAHCYQYRYLVSDNLTIQGTITSASTARVDTTAPSPPSAMSVTSGGPIWTTPTCSGVTSGTRYVNFTGQTSVAMSATIPAAEAGETVLFSATSSAPSPITVTAGPTPIAGATSANATLNLSSGSFGEGPITVTARVIDAAGNLSTTASPANVIVKDTTAAAPTGVAYVEGILVITADRLSGNSECGSTVTAVETTPVSDSFNSGVLSGTTFNFTVDTLIILQHYSYNLTAVDRAGNTSSIVVFAGTDAL
jgi:hypothetical protein